MSFWKNLFDVSDFPARWQCGRWSDAHGWLHIFSDLAVAAAYFAIPCILAYFMLRRKDLPFRGIFVLFAAFILFCGSTHLMEATIFWWPAYRLAGVLKLLTAIVSWGTIVALIPTVPKVLQMRSPEELAREVEARKQAERELQKANAELERRVQQGLAHLTEANAVVAAEREWFSTTLNSIGDAVITTDTKARVSSLNPVAQILTGWSQDEAHGKPLTEVFHIVNEQTRLPVENPALRALAEGVIVGLSNHTILISRDGNERIIDDSAAPIRRDEDIVGAVLIFRDISDRHRAEQQLRDQHRLTKTITDNATTAILMLDDKGRPAFMNAAAEAMTGFSIDEAQGVTLHELVHHTRPDGSPYPIEECPIGRALPENAALRHHEDTLIRKNGEYFPVMCNARPIRQDGVGLGTVIELLDLTEQKAAAKRLRESDERFTQLADALPQLVWTAQPDGHIDWYNKLWYEYTGATFEQMQGWGWTSVHDPELLPQVVENWKNSLETGQRFEMEFPLRGADGKFRSFLTRVLPFRDRDGKIIRWFGTNTDISEQKHTQEQLRQVAARLSEADKRKDEFLALLAHELRNPLAPIRSGLEWMESAPFDPSKFEAVRKTMARQADQLVALVDDLLDVSRITRGALELRLQRVELSAIVESAVEASRPLIDKAGHELKISLPDEPIPMRVDEHRITQALSNLLNNAAKYTPSGGTITLTGKALPDSIEISVQDSGIGIPSAMLDDVFEMFTQIGGSDGRDQGLGIGLTLVKKLVEMHGGKVAASSPGPNKGSAFTITLPLTDAGLPQPAQRETQPDLAQGLRLLIVDDNRDAAAMLSMMLDRRGHDIRIAHDGVEAIGLAAEFMPDLVLMDLGMPKMNGYEAAQWIRRQPWGQEMKLIALTGWGQKGDKLRSKEAGFDAHLVKPIRIEDLDELLAAGSDPQED